MNLIRQLNETAKVLTITPEMYEQAHGNVNHFIALVEVEDFLRVTTQNAEDIDHITKTCQTLDQYNRWAEEGKSILMPFLHINTETQQITGHEGRHRAAALLCAGVKYMPVSFKLYPSKKHEEKYGVFDAKYEMKFEDMPDTVKGQFGQGILSKKHLKLVKDGWRNLHP